MANPLLVGIDLARHENVICLLNSQGEEVGRALHQRQLPPWHAAAGRAPGAGPHRR